MNKIVKKHLKTLLKMKGERSKFYKLYSNEVKTCTSPELKEAYSISKKNVYSELQALKYVIRQIKNNEKAHL